MNVKTAPAQLGAATRLAPMLAAAGGIFSYSLMDAAMKRAGALTGVYDSLLLRALIGVVLMAPLWLLSRPRVVPRRALTMHCWRGLVSTGTSVTFFWGLARTPLAQAIALSFIAPVIALWLAAAVLGERLRRAAIVAAGLGLVGVVVITAGRLADGPARHPEIALGLGSILLSAMLYAVNLILQRQQAQISAPIEVALFQMIVMSLSLGALWPWVGQPVAMPALPYAAGSAALTAVSLIALSWGWARAEAQVLIPLEYSAFVWAALSGWFFFAEPLTLATLAGVALILAGCWIGTRGVPGHPPDHIEQTGL